ncbi:partial Asparagine synthetase [glutamine-hydrolyzing] 1, partial [Methylococcales bacterium]
MSGICGWNTYQSTQNADLSTLQRMASQLTINKSHLIAKDYHSSCALATVGVAGSIGLLQREGVFIAMHGEIRWLDAELAQTAAQLGTAHALADAYRWHGANFLDKLSGSFALAIVDNPNHRILIAIDRLGIGSMFYAIRQEQLIFSSNARSIQCHPDVVQEINPQALFDYLYFHMVPSPRCIFTGVEKLLPGQYLLFEDGKPSKRFYWQPAFKEATHSNMTRLEDEFRDILKRSIGRTCDDK